MAELKSTLYFSCFILFRTAVASYSTTDFNDNITVSTDTTSKPKQTPVDLLMWSSSEKIQITSVSVVYVLPLTLNGTKYNPSDKETTLFSGEIGSKFWALSSDYYSKRVFYTELIRDYIGIYDTETQKKSVKFYGMGFGIDDISVDWISGNVYWTDTAQKWIMVADMTFNYYKVIARLTTDVLATISVDPFNRHLYWSESSKKECSIKRSNLDGSEQTILFTFKDVDSIDDIHYDAHYNRLYWIDRSSMGMFSTASHVRYFNATIPQNVTTAFSKSASYIYSIATTKDQIFLCDKMSQKILILNQNFEVEFTLETSFPRSLLVYGEGSQPWYSFYSHLHPCHENTCSQLCLPGTGDRYTCACTAGYHLLSDGLSCGTTIVEDNFMLVTDESHSKIFQIPLESPESISALPLIDLGRPHSVAYDVTSKYIYFSDLLSTSIFRSKLNGSEKELFLSSVKVYSISIDTDSRNLYFADAESDAICVASLDHANASKTLQLHGIFETFELYVDTKLGRIFWSDWGSPLVNNGPPSGRIESSNLDGSLRKIHVTDTQGPQGIMVDNREMILYWTELITGNIGWFNLQSGHQGRFSIGVKSSKTRLTGISLFNTTLYLTDLNQPNVFQIDTKQIRSGSNNVSAVKIFTKPVFFSPSGIHVYSTTKQFPSKSPCRGVNCSHICLPKVPDGHTCTCADHYRKDNKTKQCILDPKSKNDTTPPSFGDTCPEFVQVSFLNPCSIYSTVNFIEPTATDDISRKVKVVSLKGTSPPYNLTVGVYYFQYTAIDIAKNKILCKFVIVVKSLRCPMVSFPRMKGSPTCSNSYGSVVTLACPNGPGTIKYRCNANARWLPDETPTCGRQSSNPNRTTNQDKNVKKSSLSTGSSIAIIVVVLLVCLALVFVLYKCHRMRWPSHAIWRRGDDSVYLVVADDVSDSKTSNHSNNLYTNL